MTHHHIPTHVPAINAGTMFFAVVVLLVVAIVLQFKHWRDLNDETDPLRPWRKTRKPYLRVVK